MRALDREHRVVGSERRAVVEDVTPWRSLKRHVVGVDHLPRHGQRRLELEVLVAADQAVVDLERRRAMWYSSASACGSIVCGSKALAMRSAAA